MSERLNHTPVLGWILRILEFPGLGDCYQVKGHGTVWVKYLFLGNVGVPACVILGCVLHLMLDVDFFLVCYFGNQVLFICDPIVVLPCDPRNGVGQLCTSPWRATLLRPLYFLCVSPNTSIVLTGASAMACSASFFSSAPPSPRSHAFRARKKKKTDRDRVKQCLASFARDSIAAGPSGVPYLFLHFPEGDTLNRETLASSLEFAQREASGLACWCLHVLWRCCVWLVACYVGGPQVCCLFVESGVEYKFFVRAVLVVCLVCLHSVRSWTPWCAVHRNHRSLFLSSLWVFFVAIVS